MKIYGRMHGNSSKYDYSDNEPHKNSKKIPESIRNVNSVQDLFRIYMQGRWGQALHFTEFLEIYQNSDWLKSTERKESLIREARFSEPIRKWWEEAERATNASYGWDQY